MCCCGTAECKSLHMVNKQATGCCEQRWRAVAAGATAAYSAHRRGGLAGLAASHLSGRRLGGDCVVISSTQARCALPSTSAASSVIALSLSPTGFKSYYRSAAANAGPEPARAPRARHRLRRIIQVLAAAKSTAAAPARVRCQKALGHPPHCRLFSRSHVLPATAVPTKHTAAAQEHAHRAGPATAHATTVARHHAAASRLCRLPLRCYGQRCVRRHAGRAAPASRQASRSHFSQRRDSPPRRAQSFLMLPQQHCNWRPGSRRGAPANTHVASAAPRAGRRPCAHTAL